MVGDATVGRVVYCRYNMLFLVHFTEWNKTLPWPPDRVVAQSPAIDHRCFAQWE